MSLAFRKTNMSVSTYYLNKGFTPLAKSVVLSGAGTHSVWIPKAGHRVSITSVYISSIDAAGTLAFYFDNGNDRIAQYSLAASAQVQPVIGGWDSTVSSGRIFAVKSAIQTDGISINLTGFEIPIAAV